MKERLLELIQTKNIETPLRATIDKANNLKNEEGHIIFDITGTMFKINPSIFN